MKKTRRIEIIRYTHQLTLISDENSGKGLVSEPVPTDILLELSRAFDAAESLGKADGSVRVGSDKRVTGAGRPFRFLKHLIGR